MTTRLRVSGFSVPGFSSAHPHRAPSPSVSVRTRGQITRGPVDPIGPNVTAEPTPRVPRRRLLRVPVLVKNPPPPRGTCPTCGDHVPIVDREAPDAVRCAPCARLNRRPDEEVDP